MDATVAVVLAKLDGYFSHVKNNKKGFLCGKDVSLCSRLALARVYLNTAVFEYATGQ